MESLPGDMSEVSGTITSSHYFVDDCFTRNHGTCYSHRGFRVHWSWFNPYVWHSNRWPLKCFLLHCHGGYDNPSEKIYKKHHAKAYQHVWEAKNRGKVIQSGLGKCCNKTGRCAYQVDATSDKLIFSSVCSRDGQCSLISFSWCTDYHLDAGRKCGWSLGKFHLQNLACYWPSQVWGGRRSLHVLYPFLHCCNWAKYLALFNWLNGQIQ